MRSDLSEHYCCVQKGMKNHIRVIWTHKLFSNCPNLHDSYASTAHSENIAVYTGQVT
jgi:hypothetical protein